MVPSLPTRQRRLSAIHSHSRLHAPRGTFGETLRLYDMDEFVLRMEATSVGAGILDCCFEDESGAFTVDSEGCVRRCAVGDSLQCIDMPRYDLQKGIHDIVGQHGQAACCIEHSEETGLIITTDVDKKAILWDKRMASVSHSHIVDMGVGSMVCGWISGWTGPIEVFDSLNACEASNNTFVTGDDEGYAIIWDNSSRKRLLEDEVLYTSTESDHFTALSISPSNIQLYAGLLWFPKYTRSIGSMSYNYNGQLLAIASGYPDQEASQVIARGFFAQWNLMTGTNARDCAEALGCGQRQCSSTRAWTGRRSMRTDAVRRNDADRRGCADRATRTASSQKDKEDVTKLHLCHGQQYIDTLQGTDKDIEDATKAPPSSWTSRAAHNCATEFQGRHGGRNQGEPRRTGSRGPQSGRPHGVLHRAGLQTVGRLVVAFLKAYLKSDKGDLLSIVHEHKHIAPAVLNPAELREKEK
ncbi:hypothetical protein QJS10_CPA16g00339 [Acorus calamus]|uniref:Uncharacterized protein n=1 Tax=Acorus calamus TaxID=4465 RepID=A0AAV9D3B5_ACOCL|nr:hypothetical protein QJS10_CPA16g00339 [Acorus calamus]